MRVAVLALQGAFIEHERMLQRLGVETFEIRQLSDWQQPKDGLIIPGGESTVQLKLLKQLFDGRCFEYEQPADTFDAYHHGYDLGYCIAILSSQKTILES